MTFTEYLEQRHPDFLVEKIAPKHYPIVIRTPKPEAPTGHHDYPSFKRPKPKKQKKPKKSHTPTGRIDTGSVHREF